MMTRIFESTLIAMGVVICVGVIIYLLIWSELSQLLLGKPNLTAKGRS